MQIATYDADIQHRPGAANANFDILSRAPVDELLISCESSNIGDNLTSSVSIDPGYSLVLNYFHHSSLPPPRLTISIVLPQHFTQLPLTPLPILSCANINFGDTIQLYEVIRSAQWNDSELLPFLNYLQNQQLPADKDLSNFLQQVSHHRLIDGALYRILCLSQPIGNDSTTTSPLSRFISSHEQLPLVAPK